MSIRDNHSLLGVKLSSLSSKLAELRKQAKECERLSEKLSGEVEKLSLEEPESDDEETTPRGEAAMEILNDGGLPDMEDIEGAFGEIGDLIKEQRKKLDDEMWESLFAILGGEG